MLNKNSNMKIEEARALVKEEVGVIFSKVLENSGVFKKKMKKDEPLWRNL